MGKRNKIFAPIEHVWIFSYFKSQNLCHGNMLMIIAFS